MGRNRSAKWGVFLQVEGGRFCGDEEAGVAQMRAAVKRATFLLCCLCVLIPSNAYSQGWEDITPNNIYPIHFFRSFDFQDGTFEVFVWNGEGEATRGFRLTQLMVWDSIPMADKLTNFALAPQLGADHLLLR